MDAAIFLNEPLLLCSVTLFSLTVDGNGAEMTFVPALHSQECVCVCMRKKSPKELFYWVSSVSHSQDRRVGASAGMDYRSVAAPHDVCFRLFHH